MISSVNNTTIRKVAKLTRRRERDRRRAFLVEGHRAVAAALGAGIKPGVLLYTPGGGVRRAALIEEARIAGAKVHEVSPEVMNHVTALGHAPDVLAVAPFKPASLESSMSQPVVVVLDRVKDPSVAGGVMAVAAAGGAGGVVATEGCTDVFAPAAVRAAAGAHFVVPVATGASSHAIASLSAGKRVVAIADDGIGVAKADLKAPIVVIVGEQPPDGVERVCVPAGAGGVRAGLAARAAIALHEVSRE